MKKMSMLVLAALLVIMASVLVPQMTGGCGPAGTHDVPC